MTKQAQEVHRVYMNEWNKKRRIRALEQMVADFSKYSNIKFHHLSDAPKDLVSLLKKLERKISEYSQS